MLHHGERYINPLTDFGFKRIFGTPFNKELLISFLNALLNGERVISDVTYNNSERQGSNEWARRAIFDVYCTTADGGRFIVEMQNVYQDFYKDRSIYYSTFAITDQAQRGDWDYRLRDVYTIGILNFAFPPGKQNGDDAIFREVKLMDVDKKEVFYEKLTYIYVELSRFDKPLDQCATLLDKWLFCLRNLSRLLERPAALQGRVFERLFHTAEIAKFNASDLRDYEQSANAYRDIKNGMDTAKREGMAEGIAQGLAQGREQGLAQGRAQGLAQGREDIARKMKAKGMDTGTIADLTGLTAGEIGQL